MKTSRRRTASPERTSSSGRVRAERRRIARRFNWRNLAIVTSTPHDDALLWRPHRHFYGRPLLSFTVFIGPRWTLEKLPSFYWACPMHGFFPHFTVLNPFFYEVSSGFSPSFYLILLGVTNSFSGMQLVFFVTVVKLNFYGIYRVFF